MELSPAITPEELAKIDVNRFPTQARVIIRLIGIEQTWLLLFSHGGQDIKIPLGKHSDTWLYQTLPKASADALIEQFAGLRLTLPKTDKIVKQIRDHRIYLANYHGEKAGNLARRFHLTRRSIILICKRMNAEHPINKVSLL